MDDGKKHLHPHPPTTMGANQQLIKRCPRNSASASAASPGSAGPLLGLFRSGGAASELLQSSQRLGAAGRPAGKLLPATQQRPDESRMSEAALKARQSPALSLFNRLDGLTHQLLATRDFFAQWPQQMCQRIRAKALTSQQQDTNSIGARRANSSANAECWNGRDFSGYTKALAEFGLPLSAAHPEVPVQQAQPIGPLVRDLVVRLKEIGGQLTRRSARSPYNPVELLAVSKTSDDTRQAEAQEGQGGASVRPAVIVERRDQFTAAALKLAAVNAELAGQQPPDESNGATNSPASAQAAASLPPDEDLEAPDGEAAEGDGDGEQDEPNGMAGSAAEEDGDDEAEDHPKCAMEDCSDLLPPADINNNSNNVPREPDISYSAYPSYEPPAADRGRVFADPSTRYPPLEPTELSPMVTVGNELLSWPPKYSVRMPAAPSSPGQVQLSGLQLFLLFSALLVPICLILWHIRRVFFPGALSAGAHGAAHL